MQLFIFEKLEKIGDQLQILTGLDEIFGAMCAPKNQSLSSNILRVERCVESLLGAAMMYPNRQDCIGSVCDIGYLAAGRIEVNSTEYFARYPKGMFERLGHLKEITPLVDDYKIKQTATGNHARTIIASELSALQETVDRLPRILRGLAWNRVIERTNEALLALNVPKDRLPILPVKTQEQSAAAMSVFQSLVPNISLIVGPETLNTMQGLTGIAAENAYRQAFKKDSGIRTEAIEGFLHNTDIALPIAMKLSNDADVAVAAAGTDATVMISVSTGKYHDVASQYRRLIHQAAKEHDDLGMIDLGHALGTVRDTVDSNPVSQRYLIRLCPMVRSLVKSREPHVSEMALALLTEAGLDADV